ncbi:MAG: hypothetical protein PHV21_05955, partial [Synergistaceae bacterium]|nr:hypothetical protein [Synergistaceae bacterium]
MIKSTADFLETSRRNPAIFVALVLILLSAWALLPRLAAERESKDAAIVLDYRDLATFSIRDGKSPEMLWPLLSQNGASGLMVSELT